MNAQNLLRIISGEKQGFLAAVTRFGLGLLTPLYRIGVGLRNRKFDRDPAAISKVDVPVISVGNLTTGGTGKTPMVIWICRFLRSHNIRVAIVSRGYGAKVVDGKTALNDEALELEHRLSDVPHLQDPDRVKVANIAVDELETEVIVLDDGFQHRRLHRNLDVLLIDATNPFGYDRLLPRGLLREPAKNLRRANVVVITRCENVDESSVVNIESRVKQIDPQAKLARTETVAKELMQFDGRTEPLKSQDKHSWFGFCAIGNAAAFEATLKSNGLALAGFQAFQDHHNFTREDLESIATQAQQNGATRLVCTHKDLVKVCADRIGGLALFALMIEVEFVCGEEMVQQEVINTVDDLLSDQRAKQN